MRNHLAELTKQLDSYFAHSFLQRNSMSKNEVLVDSYFQRKNMDEAIKLTQKKLKTNNDNQAKGADDYLEAFYLEKRILQNPIVRTQSLTKKDFLGNLEAEPGCLLRYSEN